MDIQSQVPLSIVMLGASGAVGSETLKLLLKMPQIEKLTLLCRKPIPNLLDNKVQQFNIDIFNSLSYEKALLDHHTAICTLGVGEPSKMSKEEFVKIDKLAVIDFAKACKKSGVKHFELLAAVSINAKSASFYLRKKGELVEELKALQFERLSIFQPSMILTPHNRYGWSQALVLKVWPYLNYILIGGLKKYRGIKVEQLGKAIALNTLKVNTGYEVLTWKDFF